MSRYDNGRHGVVDGGARCGRGTTGLIAGPVPNFLVSTRKTTGNTFHPACTVPDSSGSETFATGWIRVAGSRIRSPNGYSERVRAPECSSRADDGTPDDRSRS